MTVRKSVVIADDHPLFRSGVRQALERAGMFDVVGEASDGDETLKLIVDMKPDVAVLDIQMPVMTGIEVAKRIEHMNLDTRILLLTMLDDKRIFLEAMESGVMGYILKDSAVSEIQRAIELVCEDKHYISPSLAGLLVEKRRGGGLPAELSNLTPTEVRIMRLISDLRSNQEIADELFVSKRTIENHRANMSKKLGLTGTNSLLKLALKNKSNL